MIPLLFVLAFIIVPVIELWLILQIGDAIGVVPTIALLLIDSLVGSWLVRSQGRSVWGDFRRTTDAGGIPATQAVDGFLVVLGGTLLLVPGFLSDIVGLTFVLPPTRKALRNRLIAFVSRRTKVSFMGQGFTRSSGDTDTGMRDFARSNQPRRPTSTTKGERDPEFDFETNQLHE
jgi:UPF0716 protein FxsA